MTRVQEKAGRGWRGQPPAQSSPAAALRQKGFLWRQERKGRASPSAPWRTSGNGQYYADEVQ